MFDHYSSLAYSALNRGKIAQFLRYSDAALNTGLSNARLYYDRGYAFELLFDYKAAKKEYKKSSRMGYSPARYALKELERKRRLMRY